jgi:hypothetical protein
MASPYFISIGLISANWISLILCGTSPFATMRFALALAAEELAMLMCLCDGLLMCVHLSPDRRVVGCLSIQQELRYCLSINDDDDLHVSAES